MGSSYFRLKLCYIVGIKIVCLCYIAAYEICLWCLVLGSLVFDNWINLRIYYWILLLGFDFSWILAKFLLLDLAFVTRRGIIFLLLSKKGIPWIRRNYSEAWWKRVSLFFSMHFSFCSRWWFLSQIIVIECFDSWSSIEYISNFSLPCSLVEFLYVLMCILVTLLLISCE